MAKLPFLLLTALSVSVDSFLCGFSLTTMGLKEKGTDAAALRRKITAGVVPAVSLLCVLAAVLGSALGNAAKSAANQIGGGVLLLLGALGGAQELLSFPKRVRPEFLRAKQKKTGLLQAFSAGLGVGTDGAIATLSLAVMGYGGALSAVTVIACHAFLTDLGCRIAAAPKGKLFPFFRLLAPLVLLFLGISRFH